METLTNILFTAQDGIVYDVVHALFRAQHQDICSELFIQMQAGQDIKLSDLRATTIELE